MRRAGPFAADPVRVVPDGTVVWGMQLPIQSQSNLYVSEWERTATVDDLAAVAAAADEAGCFYVGVCDHAAIPERLVGAMGSVWYDTIATLGWLAALTRRTKLLSHVLTLSQRHPLRAAKELASIDRLSGGRLIAGIGVGHVREEFDVLVGPEAFAERGADADEAIRALAMCLEEESPTHHGRRWAFSGMHVGPRPVQKPRPPLWIGGSSARALRRVAVLGDGWLPQGTPRADLPGKIAELRDLCQELRSGAPLDIGTIAEPMYVTSRNDQDPGWDLPDRVLLGGPEQIAESLRELGRMGVNHLQIRFRVRSARECVEQIQRFGACVAPLLNQ